MTTQTLTRLRQLKLGGMASALQSQLEQVGTYEGLAFTERLALLVEQECLSREQRKQERLIHQARFKLAACVRDIDYQHPRNIAPPQIARLAQGDWINRGQNLLVTGPCGSGKTYVACALGHNACLHGYSVRYYRLSRLLLETMLVLRCGAGLHRQLPKHHGGGSGEQNRGTGGGNGHYGLSFCGRGSPAEDAEGIGGDLDPAQSLYHLVDQYPF